MTSAQRIGGSFAWVTFGVAISKVSTLLTQIALGYLLSPDDFGKYALILGALTLVSGFIDSGIGKLLVREQGNLDYYIGKAISLSIILSCLGASILSIYMYLSAPDDQKELVFATIAIALFSPLNSIAQVYKARLSIELSFAKISKIEIANSLIFSCVLVISAFSGLSLYSFSVAFIVSYGFLFIRYRKESATLINSKYRGDTIPISKLIYQARWLIVTTFMVGIALRGDYLVLGQYLNTQELGYYYFAFMLVANIGLLVAQGVNSVLLPVLAKNQNNLEKTKQAYFDFCEMFFICTSLLSLTFLCIGEQFINVIWNGKWDQATLLAILFAISLPLKMLAPVSYALLESKGQWSAKFAMTCFDAVTVLISVFVGVLIYGLTGAVACLVIQRGLTGLIIFFLSARKAEIKTVDITRRILLIYAPITATLICAFAAMMYIDNLHTNFISNLLSSLVVLLASTSVIAVVVYKQSPKMLNVLRTSIQKLGVFS